MKHIHAMLLAVGLCAASASAQNITVVMKDGSSQKFNADYVKDITLKKSDSPAPLLNFDSLKLTPYSNGEFEVVFREEEQNIMVGLYATSVSSATWLLPGNYSSDNASEYTIKPDWSMVSIGGTKVQMTGASMVVSVKDKVYTFDFNVNLQDGTSIHGTYSEELSQYTQYLESVISAASYNENERDPGNFYVKMNNADWSMEMALDIFADPKAKVLPAGTYKYSADGAVNTFGPKSYVDLYQPSSSNRLATGSKMTVKENNGVYSIDMNLKFEDGRIAHFTFDGEIIGTPTFKEEAEVKIPTDVEFTSLSTIDYTNGNLGYTFRADGVECFLDIYGGADMTTVAPGVYTFSESTTPGSVCTNYSRLTINELDIYKFKSGTFTVTEGAGDSPSLMYEIDGVLENGVSFKGSYSQKQSSESIELVIVAAAFNDNERDPGNFYVKMNSEGSDYCEMAVDIFADPAATMLPAGTYTYSEDGSLNTLGPKSYVDLYYPTRLYKLAEGSKLTVTEADGVYNLDMDFVFKDGTKAHITYSGEITGTPTFIKE